MAAIVAAMHNIRRRRSEDSTDPFGNQRPDPIVPGPRQTLGHSFRHSFLGPQRRRSRSGSREETVIQAMQRIIRTRVLYFRRLHRKNLAARLNFERHVLFGTARLANQMAVFSLFVLALVFSSNGTAKRGVHDNLNEVFDFGEIRSVRTREQFISETLPHIAAESKKYFVIGQDYYDSKGLGSFELLRDLTFFNYPLVAGQIELKSPEFTFTAWVQTSSIFQSGYILRKRASALGEDATLACFGWYLDHTKGQEFHYGAHDHFPGLMGSEDTKQTAVSQRPQSFASSEYVMLTLVVTRERAIFYHNLERVGDELLPRSVTDCFNGGEGTLLGDAELKLGAVRFYPVPLSNSSIEEILSAGSTMADISTGNQPSAVPITDLAETEMNVKTEVWKSEDSAAGRQLTKTIRSVREEAKRSEAVPALISPPAPAGALPANTSLKMDARNDPYASLLSAPMAFSSQTANYITDAPRFDSSGVTFAFWFRFAECAEAECGGYLLSAANSTGTCWSLRVEHKALSLHNALAGPRRQFQRDLVGDRFSLSVAGTWRHVTLTLDAASDTAMVYMDGVEVWSGMWGSSVASTDGSCGPERHVLLGRDARGSLGSSTEFYDVRMYVHGAGNRMSAQRLRQMSRDPTPLLSEQDKCVDIRSDEVQDSSWTDFLGNGCAWYRSAREVDPGVCQYQEAAHKCPVACGSRTFCIDDSWEEPSPFFSWDRIRRVERAGPNGTVCLASSQNRASTLARCQADQADSAGESVWRNSMQEGRRGHRVDVSDCAALDAAIDEGCSFEASEVEAFTQASAGNGGDFTIAFWVRPLGPESMHEADGQFHPHIAFFAGLSPPQHNLVLGLWDSPRGEARVFSACHAGSDLVHETVEMTKAGSEWTFVSVTRRNSGAALGTRVNANLGVNSEASDAPQCLYNASAWFSALEVNYPSLMSPIMLFPEALPAWSVQELYYRSATRLDAQPGPLVTQLQMDTSSIPVYKNDYIKRSVLVAPPILSQVRQKPSADCYFTYGTTFIEGKNNRSTVTHCSAPFSCPPEFSEPATTMQCTGTPEDESNWFDLEPTELEGLDAIGYADFLYTITDHPLVLRNGAPQEAEWIIGGMLESLQVILVFFTPEYGMTSALYVEADFSGPSSAVVTAKVRHYEMIEGDDLNLYAFIQCFTLIFIFLMCWDIGTSAVPMVRGCFAFEAPELGELVKVFTDFLTVGMVLIFILIRVPSKWNSVKDTEDVVGGISVIPWDSHDLTLQAKKQQFFDKLQELVQLITLEDDLNVACNIILIVSMLRIIQCTSLHPRLALLTGTLSKAVDDLWHGGLLILLLMGSFASIANWRFGSERADFSTMERTMQTQFEMLFGSFPEDWWLTREMQVYTVFYIVILFLLIQNFLLAIIVEAYMKVREDIDSFEPMEGFIADVANSFAAYYRAKYEGWPTPGQLGPILDEWTARLSVKYADLKRTKLFRNDRAVGSFIKWYSRYEFLEPMEVGDYEPRQTTDSGEDLEWHIAKVMGQVPTLRELAQEGCPNGNDSPPVPPTSQPTPSNQDASKIRQLAPPPEEANSSPKTLQGASSLKKPKLKVYQPGSAYTREHRMVNTKDMHALEERLEAKLVQMQASLLEKLGMPNADHAAEPLHSSGKDVAAMAREYSASMATADPNPNPALQAIGAARTSSEGFGAARASSDNFGPEAIASDAELVYARKPTADSAAARNKFRI